MLSRHRLSLCLAFALCLSSTVVSAPQIPPDLPQKYRTWLEDVELLISKKERAAFLELQEDYQRDGFIQHFWRARDPVPETAENEFRQLWTSRIEKARKSFGDLADARTRLLLLNGEADTVDEGPICPGIFIPLEAWYYTSGTRVSSPIALIFYRLTRLNPFKLWSPSLGLHELLDGSDVGFWSNCPNAREEFLRHPLNSNTFQAKLEDQMRCFAEQVDRRCTDPITTMALFRNATAGKGLQYMNAVNRLESQIGNQDAEWLATFRAHSTELPEGAGSFPAELEFLFPGRRGQRTVVQAVLKVAPQDVGYQELVGRKSYNFQLTGEILRQDKLFESFRYRFDFAAAEAGEGSLPMMFQRLLRPGEFELILKLEDVASGQFFHDRRKLTVPRVEAAAAPAVNEESAQLFAEAVALVNEGGSRLELVRPKGDLQVGMTRFEAVHRGEQPNKVSFYLDGKKALSKKRPPYSVELDLGSIPRLHAIEASAFDAQGQLIAHDQIEVNQGQNRFAVHLREPQRGRSYRRSLLARVEVEVPDSETLDRVELYLGESPVATLYQPPFEQAIRLSPGGGPNFVRAAAFLTDGNSTEDVVFVNAPGLVDELKVRLVELYAAVVDAGRHPITDLDREDFTIYEDGVQQEVLRFEQLRNLPIHASIVFDSSSSMEPNLEKAKSAALGFFEQIITPKDRAAVVTFSNRPNLVVKFTNAMDGLATEMAGVRAEGSTALWDAVVFALQYMNGIKGQRTILLLSDGKDEGSRFTFKEATTYAQTAGVTFYTIGLGLGKGALETRRRLSKLAEVTGGRDYFIEDTSSLETIYTEIQRELRAKYLLTYQSTNHDGGDSFRKVEVRVNSQGLEVRAMPGYFP